jgi:hypothetical protein
MNKYNSVLLTILPLLLLTACKPQKTYSKENPLSMNSDSETIRLKLLYSYTFWKTIRVEGLANWYVENETPQIYQQQLWIVLPTKARIISGNPDNNPDYVWISDGENILENGQLSVLPPYVNEPFSPPEVISDHIYRYPLSMVMVSPFADEIFPSGSAQRGGKYVPIKEEIVANRKALVVDWAEGTSNERFWIDVDTGVILRDQIYFDKEKTKLNQDLVMVYIDYDMAITPDHFILTMPKVMQFEEIST